MKKPTLKEIAHDLATHLAGDSTPAGGAVRIVDAVAAATAGYDDPKAELFLMATALRQGGQKLADAHPEVVTTEVFDRAASLVDAIAQAL